MKVLFYIANFSGGGAERVAVNLLNYLADREVSLELVVNKMEGPYASLINENVKVHKLNADIPRSSVFELTNYISTSKPDVAFSTIYSSNYALILAGKLSRVDAKILVRESSSFLTKRKDLSKHRFIYEKMKAKLYTFADEVIVNSKGSRKELAQVTGIRKNDINILSNPLGLDNIKRQGNESLPSDAAKFLKGSPYILAAGRLIDCKGFDTLIKAFKRLGKYQYQLIILGEGEKREDLQKLVNRLELDDRVLMPGYVDNPYTFMDKASLFVLSSRYEGMPNVLLEALSFDLPLVATDCPSGPRELLKGGKFGYLVPVDDHVSLAEAMEYQLEHGLPNKKERSLYIEKFDIQNVGKEFYSLLKKI